jgi:hypothetical protein
MNSLAKYHVRAPRYILQPEDDTLIRVSGPKQLPWEENTEISNISITGLAFVTSSDLCPVVGEFIKIQFKLPGGKPMACHALVTRLEPKKDHRVLVGVQFQKLQPSHKLLLMQALSNKLVHQTMKDEVIDVYKREREKHRWQLYFLVGFFFSLWSLSLIFFMMF